jgi:Lrp/AsnC family leucine-responsive transcriptional regulator
MITLSSRERRILAASEMDLSLPVTTLAATTRFPVHAVRWTLSRLAERGLINPRTLLNVYPLGFQDYTLLFSLAGSRPLPARKKLIEQLLKHPKVSWIGDLGSSFQLGIAVMARSIAEFLEFQELLSTWCGGSMQQKRFALRYGSIIYGRRYLDPAARNRTVLRYRTSDTGTTIDELDKRILKYLSQAKGESLRELGRELGIPSTTVDARMRRLRQVGVVVGYYNAIGSAPLQMQQYKLLITTNAASSSARVIIEKFAAQNVNVTHVIECIGSWDYEIGLEVDRGADLIALTSALYEQLDGLYSSVEVIPELTCHKFVNWPFS